MRLLSRWRLLRLLLALLLCISLLAAYTFLKSRPSYGLYTALRDSEIKSSGRKIKQADFDRSRYVLFKQLRGAGFNNQAQEVLLYHHLALLAGRVYVYQPLIWRPRGELASVPLSAFFRGVTEGTTISSALFDEICPPAETVHVTLATDEIDLNDLWEHAKDVLNRSDRCVVVDDWILNWKYLASPAIAPVWPSFQHYLSQHFEWSDNVQDIARRTHFQLNLRRKPNLADGEPYIAIHFRRGDFEDHCHVLAGEHAGLTTWATLPALSPSIYPPALNTDNETSIFEHCYPQISRILDIFTLHILARPDIRTVHILHDGAWDHPLVYYQRYQLESALKDASGAMNRGWPGPMKRVTHSGMIPLRWGEADWAVAVDVELARNADIFIGNGFSSLSTQVIALRLGADGGQVQDISLL